MTSTVEFINRWQRIALLSQSLLELAQRGEWDLLLQQEVSYLQSIETVMEKQTPPGITRSIQDMVAGYIKQTLDNEQLLKGLLELAQRGEWDLLLQQEVSYLQSIETVMEKQTPPGITRSIQDMVAGYIKQTLDNEQLLKGLL
ncbi:hypothetical protein EKL38_24145, partial [Salmonella enterica subsp. enterica serovar Typhimurium]